MLREVKERIRDYYEHNYTNDWLKTASDLDLLKFIRSSRESDIMSSLLNHNKWRKTTYGISTRKLSALLIYLFIHALIQAQTELNHIIMKIVY